MEDKKQLKEAIKREYAKCATDPVYFLGKYGIIQHPVRGKVNFNLYDFQEKSLKSFMQNDYNVVLKARQLGGRGGAADEGDGARAGRGRARARGSDGGGAGGARPGDGRSAAEDAGGGERGPSAAPTADQAGARDGGRGPRGKAWRGSPSDPRGENEAGEVGHAGQDAEHDGGPWGQPELCRRGGRVDRVRSARLREKGNWVVITYMRCKKNNYIVCFKTL